MQSSEHNKKNQYLTFTLGDETYGAHIDYTKEVLEVPSITKVPRTPNFMLGVINLRGNVVPVVDVRLKFGMPPKNITKDSAIIILEINFGGEPVTAGALVDRVNEVIELNRESIEKPPKIGMPLSADVIEGIGKQGNKFIIVLNIDKLFSQQELSFGQNSNKENKI